MADDYITKLSIYKATKMGAPVLTQTRTSNSKMRKAPMRMTSNIELDGSDEEVNSLNQTKVPQKVKQISSSHQNKQAMLEDI